jgi:hypothetical protein
MLTIKGILKQDQIKEFVRKDGSTGKSRIVYIEVPGDIFPVRISLDDLNTKIGSIGDKVALDVVVYPYYLDNGQRKRAFISYFVPNK